MKYVVPAELADAFADIEKHNCRVTAVRLSPGEERHWNSYGYCKDGTLWGADVLFDDDQPEGTFKLSWRANDGGPGVPTAWVRVLVDRDFPD